VYYLYWALRDPNKMFYLDASYAQPLYSENATAAEATLLANGVSEIFLRIQDWNSTWYADLAWAGALGDTSFPILFVDGRSVVYAVG